jgi:hypothetical protein
MITGCNTNVRHGGRTFHVQTEDSGRAHPHIISHVYHGGTIIASEKSEYGDLVDSESLDDEVRARIEAQHGAMLKRLGGGEFDGAIAERLGDPGPKASVSETGATTGGIDTAPAIAAEPAADPDEAEGLGPKSAFGDAIDSQKPLDEVILEYLVKKARDRGGDNQERARGSARRKG